MAQSFGPVYIHIVFSTKHRESLLSNDLHTEFARYITPILKDCKARLITEGGMPDHVHLLIDLGRESSVAAVLREIKAKSSAWLRKKTGKSFGRQSGYGVFSVSPSHLPNVMSYIEHQEEHHRHTTFQEEFEEMLKTAGVEYDPKWLWHDDDAE
ncbi:MAG: IS200/IS605 family transposase [Bacteroidota bacterium]|nr:IS200/IS605 family transposase [Bacteroidota bacterium]MDP4234531.1 IS200/IS605 family transposase [Bacteroidota bacterium]MDP4242596.1 IS200/IS605 family transposase [Bacteroidota bacterium]MDP4289172.1 IS200/IS605 family transposase [Bacteroidota bacterium]